MDLRKMLNKIGLTDKEAKVYLTLLELQETIPSVISRRSGIKRPTTYVILEQLQKRGLCSHVRKGRTLYYRALNPHALLEDQYNKYSELEKAMPELVSLHEKYVVTPQMTVYEGAEGVIKIMNDTLHTSTGLLCWADVTVAVDGLSADFYESYIKTKVERGVWLKGVFCYDSAALRFKKKGREELREVYLVPKEKFPFKNEINIYDDKVAIVSYEEKVGVIIQNKTIADTQRAIFDLGFEYARMIEQDVLTDKDLEYLGGDRFVAMAP